MEGKKYFHSLVALRGFLIMGIVFFHASDRFEAPFYSLISFIYQYGGLIGNYIFFALSGFLIAHNYKERICNEELSLVPFVKKRIFKIYPLYLITNFICLVILIYENGWTVTNLTKLMLNILMMAAGWMEEYTPYNPPCWFVCVLMLCYVLYWIVCALSKNNKDKYYLLIFSLTIIGYILRKSYFVSPFAYANDGEGFLNFFMGCITYEIYISLSEQYRKNAGLFGGLILVILTVASHKLGFEVLAGDVGFLLSVLIAPCIILCSIECRVVNKILNLSPLSWLGRISMSIYFWHIPLAMLLAFIPFYMNIDHRVRFLLYLVILLIGSSISYLIIENFPNWVKRYSKDL